MGQNRSLLTMNGVSIKQTPSSEITHRSVDGAKQESAYTERSKYQMKSIK